MRLRSLKDADAASRWTELPFDISSIIFDHVVASFPVQNYDADTTRAEYTESETALKQCFLAFALVCHPWHAAAMPYFLRVLSFRFGASPSARSRGLSDILQWLDTQPRLPTAVRHLRLVMAEPTSNGCDPALLHTLLRRFPNMRAFELFNAVFDSAQLAAHISMLTTAHTDAFAPIDVDTLTIVYGVRRPPDADAAQLCVAWFGRVSTFVVRALPRSGWTMRVSGALDRLPARLAACTLVLDIYSVPAGVAACLHRSPTFEPRTGTLRTLRIALTPFSQATLGALVRPAAHTLEALHLDLTSYFARRLPRTVVDIDIDLDLDDLRTRELTLQFPLMHDTSEAAACWTVVQAVIDALRLRGVRRVTLVLHDDSGVEPTLAYLGHGPRLARIDALLAGVPTLERCTLDLRAVLDAFGVLAQRKAWFRNHMAGLDARGLLCIVA
ncbi:hypothetical protein BDW22DRAFT_1356618 [Trametopsis cervina]|nr:hypothetical protein BDW22DRAFT_1356618 [Trametopsis cervina]